MPLFTLTIDKAVPIFMILSGYVYSISAKNKSLKELYSFPIMKKKFIRFTVPMAITFMLYLSLMWIGGKPLTLFGVFKAVAIGDYGMGAYYYNLMIEFIFLAPILHRILKRFDTNGVILIGMLNFIYEVLSSAYGLHVALYRVIILRYLFAISLGMYIGKYRERKISPVVLVTMMVAGAIYILLPYVWEYSYRIFTYDPWGRTSMVSVLYAFPIIYIFLDGCKDYTSKTIFGKTVERIGRASYHIMYVQMIYYFVRPTFDKVVVNLSALGYFELIVNISVTVLSGIVFEMVLSRVAISLTKKN